MVICFWRRKPQSLPSTSTLQQTVNWNMPMWRRFLHSHWPSTKWKEMVSPPVTRPMHRKEPECDFHINTAAETLHFETDLGGLVLRFPHCHTSTFTSREADISFIPFLSKIPTCVNSTEIQEEMGLGMEFLMLVGNVRQFFRCRWYMLYVICRWYMTSDKCCYCLVKSKITF